MKIAHLQVELICSKLLIGWCILMYDVHAMQIIIKETDVHAELPKGM